MVRMMMVLAAMAEESQSLGTPLHGRAGFQHACPVKHQLENNVAGQDSDLWKGPHGCLS
ncbi:hypothetical protein RUM44_001298 [Polyplax serrata]|uniref:Uncharacterized protein n=1 Tax=Polyplax serrata TaxID=468196 RepID=A0ABR1AJL1_POLSC